MNIERVGNYTDCRFSQKVLNQHGCFLIDDEPYEVEIISDYEAIVRGNNRDYYKDVIEEFLFYSPHITKYYDNDNKIVLEKQRRTICRVNLSKIQPSHFYVDQDKVIAISEYIQSEEDIIIQVMRWKDQFVSLDGHTRLYIAAENGWEYVYCVIEDEETWAIDFVNEAQKNMIFEPKDLKLLEHNEYEVKWNQFCDTYFRDK